MTTRDSRLVAFLVVQAAINAASSSASLAALAPPSVVAGVALISAMLSAGTAAYIAIRRPSDTPA